MLGKLHEIVRAAVSAGSTWVESLDCFLLFLVIMMAFLTHCHVLYKHNAVLR